MATSSGIHDVAAALFVDALGRNLPMREHFSYKELHDFLRKEGVLGLDELDGQDLVKIASTVGSMTKGNVKINATPVVTATVRTPLSSVDLRVSGERPLERKARPIQVTDLVTLKDGAQLHVVETRVGKCAGMDDMMHTRVFAPEEIEHIVSMDEPL